MARSARVPHSPTLSPVAMGILRGVAAAAPVHDRPADVLSAVDRHQVHPSLMHSTSSISLNQSLHLRGAIFTSVPTALDSTAQQPTVRHSVPPSAATTRSALTSHGLSGQSLHTSTILPTLPHIPLDHFRSATPILRAPPTGLSPSPAATLDPRVAAGLCAFDTPVASFEPVPLSPRSPSSDTDADNTPTAVFAPQPTVSLDETKMLTANAQSNTDVTALIKRSKRKAAATDNNNIGTAAAAPVVGGGFNDPTDAAATATAAASGSNQSHHQLLESVVFTMNQPATNTQTRQLQDPTSHQAGDVLTSVNPSGCLPEINFVSSAPGELFTRLLHGTSQAGGSTSNGQVAGGLGNASTTSPGTTTEDEDLALLVTTLTAAISRSLEQQQQTQTQCSNITSNTTSGGVANSKQQQSNDCSTRDEIADQPMNLAGKSISLADEAEAGGGADGGGHSRRQRSPRQRSPSAGGGGIASTNDKWASWSPAATHQPPHSDIYQPVGSLESTLIDNPQRGWVASAMALPHPPIAHVTSNTSSSGSGRHYTVAPASTTLGSGTLQPAESPYTGVGLTGFGAVPTAMIQSFAPSPNVRQSTGATSGNQPPLKPQRQQQPQPSLTAPQQQQLLQSIIGLQPPQLLSIAATAASVPSLSAFLPMWPPSEEDYLTVNGLSLRAWRSYLLNLACCTDTETLYTRLSFGLANDLARGRMPGYHNAQAHQNAAANHHPHHPSNYSSHQSHQHPNQPSSTLHLSHGSSSSGPHHHGPLPGPGVSVSGIHQRTVSWNVPPPPGTAPPSGGGLSQRPSINTSGVNGPQGSYRQQQQQPSSTSAVTSAAHQFPFSTATNTVAGGTGGVTSPTASHLPANTGTRFPGGGGPFGGASGGVSCTGGGSNHPNQPLQQQHPIQPGSGRQITSGDANYPSIASGHHGSITSGNQTQQGGCNSLSGTNGERPPPSEGRFRQIARCKSTPEYLLYISRVPKSARGPDDPQTPRVAGTTWREFSSDVRMWKKALHRKKEAIEAEDTCAATMGLPPSGEGGLAPYVNPWGRAGSPVNSIELPPSAAEMFVAGFGTAAAAVGGGGGSDGGPGGPTNVGGGGNSAAPQPPTAATAGGEIC